MCEQVKEILQINLQTNLNQLQQQKCMVNIRFLFCLLKLAKCIFQEIEKCCAKYSNQFNELEIRLKRHVHSDEYDIPRDNSFPPYSPIITSASLSTGSYFSSEVNTSNPHTRRQTMQ
jgi:hypothetical protein